MYLHEDRELFQEVIVSTAENFGCTSEWFVAYKENAGVVNEFIHIPQHLL